MIPQSNNLMRYSQLLERIDAIDEAETVQLLKDAVEKAKPHCAIHGSSQDPVIALDFKHEKIYVGCPQCPGIDVLQRWANQAKA